MKKAGLIHTNWEETSYMVRSENTGTDLGLMAEMEAMLSFVEMLGYMSLASQ